MPKNLRGQNSGNVLVFGVGSFAQSMMRILRDNGANVFAYLNRPYAHFPPSLEGTVFTPKDFPTPLPILRKKQINLVLPMSIDWAQQPWARDLISSGTPILCPFADALKMERERDFARELCARFRIPFPKSFFAKNVSDAEKIVRKEKRPFVIKNPLCGPSSPIHTIVCEEFEDTLGWLPRLDFSEGVFLQEYLGRKEAGHFVFISGGEIHSLATNQEYKRAFEYNQGIVAGAPLGGLVEQDFNDKYGLARELIHPLMPWFKETGYHGPLQVTAIKYSGKWHVLEYNVRLGVTSGAMILRMLKAAPELLAKVARNEKIRIEGKSGANFGCSVTLAGYGYPFTQITGPKLPIKTPSKFSCDVWWNEVERVNGKLFATGHRIADIVAVQPTLKNAIKLAYENIAKISFLSSYYRHDIGQTLWPPGAA